MHLNIRVAKTAGFCFGVQRAIDQVFEIVTDSERPIRTAGPLIHNEHVLEILRARGVLELQSDDALENECVVIRAHGVAPDVLKGFKDRGAMVCNVTCPKVAQVQGIVKKYARSGYTIIIVGDRGHAEVEGLLGYAQGSGYAVSGPEDIDRLPPAKKICIVAQTTQSIDTFAKTVEMLEKRYADCSVFNTICNATSERQLETKRLAQISDLMVVVGSPTSANTQRLFEISSELCRTITIRSVNDLTPDNIGSARNIGVTAGASTPSWVIQQIVDRIKEIGWAKSGLIFRSLYQFLRLAVQTNLLFSTGLLGIYLGSIRMLEIPYSQASALSCFWFPFLALNLKSLLDRKDTILGLSYIRNIVRDRRRVSILMIGLVTAVVYFLMSTQSVLLISGTAFLTIFAVLYSMIYALQVSNSARATGIKLMILPMNILFSALCGASVAIYPVLASGMNPGIEPLTVSLLVAILVYIRSLILDLRGMQSDLMTGVRTLPLLAGKDRVKELMAFLFILGVISPLILGGIQLDPSMMLLAVPPFYFFFYLFLYHRRIIFMSLVSDVALDLGIWLIAGIQGLTVFLG